MILLNIIRSCVSVTLNRDQLMHHKGKKKNSIQDRILF